MSTSAVDLFWLPLGAGGWFVRHNGRAWEHAAALIRRRPALDLYHSALEVRLPEGRWVIEQTPVRPSDGPDRGVVAQGAVGLACAARLRVFRYEVRRWREGVIPDVAEAVDSPRRLSDDPALARTVYDLVPRVPALVWGRDALHLGEMWNSNSIVAWILERAGIDAAAIAPPPGGRAPGWDAGVRLARRPGAP